MGHFACVVAGVMDDVGRGGIDGDEAAFARIGGRRAVDLGIYPGADGAAAAFVKSGRRFVRPMDRMLKPLACIDASDGAGRIRRGSGDGVENPIAVNAAGVAWAAVARLRIIASCDSVGTRLASFICVCVFASVCFVTLNATSGMKASLNAFRSSDIC